MNDLRNYSTDIVEPSDLETDVITTENNLDNKVISKTRSTGHTSKLWTVSDKEILSTALEDNKSLSEIKLLLPNRSVNALLKRARDIGYASNKIHNDIYFSQGIKRRNRASTKKTPPSNEKSIETEQAKPSPVKDDDRLKGLFHHLLDLNDESKKHIRMCLNLHDEDRKYVKEYLDVISEIEL